MGNIEINWYAAWMVFWFGFLAIIVVIAVFFMTSDAIKEGQSKNKEKKQKKESEQSLKMAEEQEMVENRKRKERKTVEKIKREEQEQIAKKRMEEEKQDRQEKELRRKIELKARWEAVLNKELEAEEKEKILPKEELLSKAEKEIAFTVKNFKNLRNSIYSRNNPQKNGEFSGIYILYNLTNGKRYVGQSKRVIKRVYDHFTGNSGNKRIHSDYMKDHFWMITLMNLENSPYDNLNQMEREMIAAYDTYDTGYNLTRGNN